MNNTDRIETLRQFAKLVVNRKVSEADAQKWIADLTNGKLLTASELEETKVPDQAIRDWLASVRQRIEFTPGTPNEEFKLAEELKRAHEAIQEKLPPRSMPSQPQTGK